MSAAFPSHKTKIVATIGPASESPEMLQRLIRAGLNVARLNFSHGDFSRHEEVVRRIRDAERATGRRVAIMADLPGPKMRLGKIDPEPIQLVPGDKFTLTTEEIVGNAQRVSMSFEPLPRVVKPGNRLFLNDGLVQLVVSASKETTCIASCRRRRIAFAQRVESAGHRAWDQRPSRRHDHTCLEFALERASMR
jgi:pyruvate kinase